jgi:hypothetical protein
LENTEDNSEMICKIWKKDKLNSEMIWKLQKKIVKIYGNYGRKTNRIDKRFEKYRSKL